MKMRIKSSVYAMATEPIAYSPFALTNSANAGRKTVETPRFVHSII